MPDISPLWLSVKVAGAAILMILPMGIALSWWLAHGKSFRGKGLIETAVTLPLVLPPTVVGFYLLLVFGRGTPIGRWMNDSAGIRLLFTWQGAAVAASIMALPLFIRTATAAFATVERELLEAGRTLGATESVLLLNVIIPMSYRGMLAGAALAFARALGEFGATLMVAGSIPGRTQTLPLALYSAVQAGSDTEARFYTVILTITAFVILGAVGSYESRLTALRGDG